MDPAERLLALVAAVDMEAIDATMARLVGADTMEAINATMAELVDVLGTDPAMWHGAIATAAHIGIVCDLVTSRTGNPDGVVISHALVTMLTDLNTNTSRERS